MSMNNKDGSVDIHLSLPDFLLLHAYTKNWITTLHDGRISEHTKIMLQNLHKDCNDVVKKSLFNTELDPEVKQQLIEYLTKGDVYV